MYARGSWSRNRRWDQALFTSDFEIGQYIRERIVPRTILYFTGEALEDEDFEEEEEGEEDEDDEYDPVKSAKISQECKSSWLQTAVTELAGLNTTHTPIWPV